jgi:hypothetical protein
MSDINYGSTKVGVTLFPSIGSNKPFDVTTDIHVPYSKLPLLNRGLYPSSELNKYKTQPIAALGVAPGMVLTMYSGDNFTGTKMTLENYTNNERIYIDKSVPDYFMKSQSVSISSPYGELVVEGFGASDTCHFICSSLTTTNIVLCILMMVLIWLMFY